MTKKVLVAIADGSEEIEVVCLVDVLRRGGAEVTVASVDGLEIVASRGVKLVADKLISECVGQRYDLLALPGGMPGAEHLRDCAELTAMLKEQKQSGRLYGAICAAPAVVLAYHGLLEGRKATCYPSLASELEKAETTDAPVIVDGNCVTSRGPGTAILFSLKLVELLFGSEKAKETADAMLV